MSNLAKNMETLIIIIRNIFKKNQKKQLETKFFSLLYSKIININLNNHSNNNIKKKKTDI